MAGAVAGEIALAGMTEGAEITPFLEGESTLVDRRGEEELTASGVLSPAEGDETAGRLTLLNGRGIYPDERLPVKVRVA